MHNPEGPRADNPEGPVTDNLEGPGLDRLEGPALEGLGAEMDFGFGPLLGQLCPLAQQRCVG